MPSQRREAQAAVPGGRTRRRPGWLLTVGSHLLAVAASGQATSFRVLTEEAGIHRLDFETLHAAGLGGEVPSTDLGMDSAGSPVPIWTADGGDGRFGPGDWIEFAATTLRGPNGNLHERAGHNVYWLRLEPGPRMVESSAGAAAGASAAPLERRVRLEEDELMARLSAKDIGGDPEPELWFWAKLTHIDAEPFRLPLDLDGLAAGGGAVRLQLRFRALSEHLGLPAGVPGHMVQAALGPVDLGRLSWSGRQPVLLDLPALPAAETLRGARLELAVPARSPKGLDGPVIDVVLLAAVELSYPHDGSTGEAQIRLSIAGPGSQAVLRTDRRGVVAYTDAGRRVVLPRGTAVLPLEAGEAAFWLAPPGALHAPAEVVAARASTWAGVERQADYLMIAHHSLIDAVEPLAAFHRRHGLSVAVVDVQDLYDEFSDGIVHPVAIRRFLTHAWLRWRRPAPRYVLLVGDASWDIHDRAIDDSRYANWADRQLLAPPGRFRARDLEAYDGPVGRARNLIPAPSYRGFEGHAASDHWYAMLDGDDPLPELAVGRFPVVSPEQVGAIVAKTIRYAASPPVGPWRRRALWIANEQEGVQTITEGLASGMVERGFTPTRIYPSPDEASNETHQADIQEAFDSGQYLVHFMGHGGRFIWRTGPPDLRKDHDLFTLEHLEQLTPSTRLPVVLSMTCHTGPFDHPSADSIAEKLLRMPDRGAVAVVAASWRTAPMPSFSRLLVEQLSQARRVGDAVVEAKRRYGHSPLVDLYNLFGDPALPLPAPHPVHLTAVRAGDTVEVRAALDERAAGGRALIEVFDRDGTAVGRHEGAVEDPAFEVRLSADGTAWLAHAYFWNEAEAWDGGGLAMLP